MTEKMCSEFTANFSAWLKDKVGYYGISGRELAKMSGIPANSIYGYLTGEHEPSFFAVCCICNALGYRVDVEKVGEPYHVH